LQDDWKDTAPAGLEDEREACGAELVRAEEQREQALLQLRVVEAEVARRAESEDAAASGMLHVTKLLKSSMDDVYDLKDDGE
jgi:hypothetical protein